MLRIETRAAPSRSRFARIADVPEACLHAFCYAEAAANLLTNPHSIRWARSGIQVLRRARLALVSDPSRQNKSRKIGVRAGRTRSVARRGGFTLCQVREASLSVSEVNSPLLLGELPR